jgi:hypothetical protein
MSQVSGQKCIYLIYEASKIKSSAIAQKNPLCLVITSYTSIICKTFSPPNSSSVCLTETSLRVSGFKTETKILHMAMGVLPPHACTA